MPRLKTCGLCDGRLIPCGSLRVCASCGNNSLRPLPKYPNRRPIELERCREAGERYGVVAIRALELRKKRNAVIREAHKMGFGYRRIAAAMGISISRIQQIVNEE